MPRSGASGVPNVFDYMGRARANCLTGRTAAELVVAPAHSQPVEELGRAVGRHESNGLIGVLIDESHPREHVLAGLHDRAADVRDERCLVRCVHEDLVALAERAKRPTQTLAIADVGRRHQDAAHIGVVGEIVCIAVYDEPRSGGVAAEAKLCEPCLRPVASDLCELARNAVPVIGMDEADQIVPDELGGLVVKELRPCSVM